MKFLQLGVATTIETYRSDFSNSATSFSISDTSGAVISTVTATNDTANIAITADIQYGDYQATVSAPVDINRSYLIAPAAAGTGPNMEVYVYACTTGTGYYTVSFRFPLVADVASGSKIRGIRSYCSFTPAANATYKSVIVTTTYSDGSKDAEEYSVVKYKAKNPIKNMDVLQKWGMLRDEAPEWQRRTGVDWQPQIDAAWNRATELLLQNGMIIHYIRNVSSLTELLWAILGYDLTSSGYDPTGSQDRDETLRIFYRQIQSELRALQASHLWYDYGQSLTANNENSKPTYWMMGHERRARDGVR